MTKEQQLALCNLIRAYTRLRIDSFQLFAMMVAAKDRGELPEDIHEELRRLRELPAMRAEIEETERLISLVQRANNEDALMMLIFDLSKKDQLPN